MKITKKNFLHSILGLSSKKPIRAVFLLIFFTTLASSCNTPPKNTRLDNAWRPLPKSEYKKLILKNTKTHRGYSGLQMIFQVSATFLNSQIQTNILKMQSQYLNWSAEEAQRKLLEHDTNLAKESQIFLAFYTPNKLHNKLNIEASSWKVILKTAHHNIEGKVVLKENLDDYVKVFFPHMDLWSKPYIATFPISTREIENDTFWIEVIGPEGMASFKF